MERKGQGERYFLLCGMYKFGAGYLTVDDLREVRKATFCLRSKWYDIGIELKMSTYDLDAIKVENPQNTKDCLTEMLKKWLSNANNPTWNNLVQALSSESVGEKKIAENIGKQYCHQDKEQATGPVPGEL